MKSRKTSTKEKLKKLIKYWADCAWRGLSDYVFCLIGITLSLIMALGTVAVKDNILTSFFEIYVTLFIFLATAYFFIELMSKSNKIIFAGLTIFVGLLLYEAVSGFDLIITPYIPGAALLLDVIIYSIKRCKKGDSDKNGKK